MHSNTEPPTALRYVLGVLDAESVPVTATRVSRLQAGKTPLPPPCCIAPRQSDHEAVPAPQPRQVFSSYMPVLPPEIPHVTRWPVHAMPSTMLRPLLALQDPGAIACNMPSAHRRSVHPVRIAVDVPTLARQHVAATWKDGPHLHRRPSCPMQMSTRVAPLSADHPAAMLDCELALLHLWRSRVTPFVCGQREGPWLPVHVCYS